jgi:hypothetical protein
VLGVLLLVLGVPVLVAGTVAAVYVGPDDTAFTGPHRLSTDGVAIVTTPEVLAYVGPTLHLRVRSTSGDPVFVGVADDVNVQSYLGTAAHREVTDVSLPWKVTSEETGVRAAEVPAPGEQTWWLASVSGPGERSLVWPITNGRYAIAAFNADGGAGLAADVTLGLEVEGAFYAALAVAALGLLLVLLGVLCLVWRRLRRRRSPAAAGTPVAVPIGPVPPVDARPAEPAQPYPTVAPATGSAPASTSGAAAFDDDPTITDLPPVEPARPDPPPRRLFDDLAGDAGGTEAGGTEAGGTEAGGTEAGRAEAGGAGDREPPHDSGRLR